MCSLLLATVIFVPCFAVEMTICHHAMNLNCKGFAVQGVLSTIFGRSDQHS